MFKLTGKAKEDFSNELNIPLEKYLESMSDTELLISQMFFFDKVKGLDIQHTLKKSLKYYSQDLFQHFIKTIEKTNLIYNDKFSQAE